MDEPERLEYHHSSFEQTSVEVARCNNEKKKKMLFQTEAKAKVMKS